MMKLLALLHPPKPPAPAVRKCPECLEEVAAGARKCKHCGSSIPVTASLHAMAEDADLKV
jgi:hypothetical protein